MQNPAQGKFDELIKRLLFTIAMLCVFRMATQVPVPGVDGSALAAFFENQTNSALGMFNKFTGGALKRFSILALGVMPYITSSIIFSLLTVSFPFFAEIQKEPDGQKKLTQWSRYATVLLCFFQGWGLALMMENFKSPLNLPIVLEPGLHFRLLTVISLTAGTIFLMWLGEQITERGIGNGISLIIFAGIAAGIPRGIRDTINLYRSGELTGFNLIVLAAIMLAAFWIIIYIERAMRKIPVQYAKRVVNNRVYGGQASHLPIKLNISGVMPPIFASALLGFPATILSLAPERWETLKMVLDSIQQSLYPGRTLYNVVFVGFIIFFAYFYASVQFKTKDISENLQKNGGFVPGIRPGPKTAEFLDYVVSRLTLFGGIYVALICILPIMLLNLASVPFYFGGTSLLILVGVAIDTLAQIESFLISDRYSKIYKVRGKYAGAKRF
ncbi:MAG: preprotein translocase subunit SecY [Halobacteriovoraceae bacterium]|nr:preprotein translocase subunit SecY [Halobacteriovoraceae bacterium]